MEEVISGIVVGSVDYGDNDKILNVFTPERGMVSARIKGVKKAGAKLKFAAEPFCFAEYVFSKTGDRRTVIGATLIDSFYHIREDVRRFYGGCAVLEFIRAFCHEGIVSPELFVSLAKTLEVLAYRTKEVVYSVLARFFVKAIEQVGYGLNLSGCIDCGGIVYGRTFFEYGSGGFICEKCHDGSRGKEINNVTYRALCRARKGEKLDAELGTYAMRLIYFYLREKADVNLKSLKELLLMK